METLDDELLLIVRLIKRQTNSQKRKVLGKLSEQQNYIVAGDMILFLTQAQGSNEIKCNYLIKLEDIFGTFHTDCFLYLLTYSGILYTLNLEEHKLYYWEPATDSAYTGLMFWKCKTRIGSFWQRLLNKIKR